MGCYRGGVGHSVLALEEPSVNIRISFDRSNFFNSRNYSCPARKLSNVREKVIRGPNERTWTLSRVTDVADFSMGTNIRPSLSESGLKDKKANVQTFIGFNLNFDKTMFGPSTPITGGYNLPTGVQINRSASYSDKATDSEYSTPKICVGFNPTKLQLGDLSPISYMSTDSPSFTPNEITEVIPDKLYLGCQFRALKDDELLSLGITHILSVTNHIYPVKGIEHEHFVMSDFGKTELNTVLDKVYPFMESAQQSQNKLFVHCTLGQNRSPTIVISYLMKKKGLTLYEAHKMLKEKRRLIQINQDYAKMLLKLEKDLFGETSLPDDWMEANGRDSIGIPLYKSEELTVKQQALFKSSQCVLKEQHV